MVEVSAWEEERDVLFSMATLLTRRYIARARTGSMGWGIFVGVYNVERDGSEAVNASLIPFIALLSSLHSAVQGPCDCIYLIKIYSPGTFFVNCPGGGGWAVLDDPIGQSC